MREQIGTLLRWVAVTLAILGALLLLIAFSADIRSTGFNHNAVRQLPAFTSLSLKVLGSILRWLPDDTSHQIVPTINLLTTLSRWMEIALAIIVCLLLLEQSLLLILLRILLLAAAYLASLILVSLSDYVSLYNPATPLPAMAGADYPQYFGDRFRQVGQFAMYHLPLVCLIALIFFLWRRNRVSNKPELGYTIEIF
jgi:hypothetical protein